MVIIKGGEKMKPVSKKADDTSVFVWQDYEGTFQRRSRLAVEGRISTKEDGSRGHKTRKGGPTSVLRRTDEGKARRGPLREIGFTRLNSMAGALWP